MLASVFLPARRFLRASYLKCFGLFADIFLKISDKLISILVRFQFFEFGDAEFGGFYPVITGISSRWALARSNSRQFSRSLRQPRSSVFLGTSTL